MEIAAPLVVGGVVACSVSFACGADLSSRKLSLRAAMQRLVDAVAECVPEGISRSERAWCLADAWCDCLPLSRLGLVIEGARMRIAALALSVCAAAVALAIISMSVFGLLLGALTPFAVATARAYAQRKKDVRTAEEAMPEAFSALSMSLGSGHSLAQGMRFVGAHAAEPVHTEFVRVACAIECGVAATDALDDMLVRLDAPGLSLVALSLKVSQRTGAPLAGLLSEAASMCTDRMELKRRLDVKTSQARMSAHMVAAMPAAMVLLLSLLSADFRRGLSTPTGVLAVTVGFVLNAAALAVIRKIMQVKL